MDPVVRTLAQLLALYQDNDIGAITAGDGRDEIASCFGFFSSLRSPGPLDDNVGTGGSGAFFDTGSKWLNLVTGQVFECFSGAPSAAVWKGQAYDGEPMGGRVTGQFPYPVLTATGVVPGTYGGPTRVPKFTVMADGTLSAAADYPFTIPDGFFLAQLRASYGYVSSLVSSSLTGNVSVGDYHITGVSSTDLESCVVGGLIGGSAPFPGGTVIQFIDPTSGTLEVSEPASSTGGISFTVTPLCYGFDEQTINPDTGSPYLKPGGIGGDYTVVPAFELQGQDLEGALYYVFMRERGVSSGGLTLYEFSVWTAHLPQDGEFESLVVTTDHVTETVVTDDTVTTTNVNVSILSVTASVQFTPQPSPSLYPDSLWVDVNGDLVYNDSSGTPLPVSVGSTWNKYEIDYTQMVWGSSVPSIMQPGWWIVIKTVPANQAVLRVVAKTTVAWSQMNPITIEVVSVLASYSSGVGYVPPSPNPPAPVVGQGTQYAYILTRPSANWMPETDGTCVLAVSFGGSLGLPYTAGHARIYIEWGSFIP